MKVFVVTERFWKWLCELIEGLPGLLASAVFFYAREEGNASVHFKEAGIQIPHLRPRKDFIDNESIEDVPRSDPDQAVFAVIDREERDGIPINGAEVFAPGSLSDIDPVDFIG